jgi:photosystem II stability/assembly factor-like uncharacterized protein
MERTSSGAFSLYLRDVGKATIGFDIVARMITRSAALLFATLAAASAADEMTPRKPPLTKEEERARFHPRALGMEPGPRLAGYARRLEMEAASPLARLRFRGVGPEVQGGRIVDIEGVPGRPDALLVAFASGGLWRTDNRGGSWTPLFDRESAMTIGDFAVADADARVMYVGTGENNSSRSSYAGTGIFKTTDGGKTWANVGLHDSHHIGRVIVDRANPDVVLVAAAGHLYTENAERGVYRSPDGGRTWERVLFVNDRTGAIDLVQHPARPEVLYAATWERARTAANFLESGPGSGVWRSADGGRTWSRLAGGLPAGATVGRIGLDVSPARPDTVYAVIDSQARKPEGEPFDEDAPPGELTARRLRGLSKEQFLRLDDATLARFLKDNEFPKALTARGLKAEVKKGTITLADVLAYVQDANRDLFEREIVGPEVFRSDDAGATWRRTHEKGIDKVYYSYGYYFGRVHVDPTDAERVYISGVPLLGSADGGRTWRGLDARGVHVDHHALYIDPRASHRVALGNDGGLNLSFDHGQTWTKVNNLPVGQFTTLALDNAEPYNILGGLQDNGVMRGPSTYVPGTSDPNAWKSIWGGDGSAVVPDPKDPNVVYTAYQFGNAVRLDLKSGARERFKPRHELSATKKEKPLRYNWIAPIILSPHSRDILYFGTNRVHRSFDRGETWTAISEDLTSNPEQGDVPFGTLTALAESPKRFGVLYAGTDEGKVWGTRDGGVTWSDLSRGLAAARWVTRVVASAHDEGTVYVAQNGYRNDDFAPYVFRSRDFGKTWEPLAAGLPAEPVNTVREDPKAAHLLYVGTDAGVFVSLDAGATWTAMAGGLPHVPVHDVQVHPREGDLVVGTHGRSVYVAEAAPLRQLTAETRAKALHAFPVKTVTASADLGYGEHPWITWARQPVVVRFAYWSKAAGPATVAIRDTHGSPWRELTDTAVAGMNVVEYDLSADPKLADAAEAVARDKARAKKDEERDEDEDETEDGDRDTPESTSSASGKAMLDPELERLLADPMRSTRRRYLPPGRYTVEIKSGGATSKTKLTVKAPKAEESARAGQQR